MRYDPDIHEAALARLNETASDRQLFFALWCQEAVWKRGGRYLLKQLSSSQSASLLQARETLWLQALGGPVANVADVVDAALAGFEVHEDDFSGKVRCAAELSDLLLMMSQQRLSESALRSGVFVIEQLIFFLQEVATDDYDYDSAPPVMAELNRQFVMIDALLEGPPNQEMRALRQAVDLFI